MYSRRWFVLWLVAWVAFALWAVLLWDNYQTISSIFSQWAGVVTHTEGMPRRSAQNNDGVALDGVVQTHADEYYLRKFGELFTLVQELYYTSDKQPLDKDAMYESAFKWFLNGLGDAYTTYMTASENTKFTVDLEGSKEFFGIWAAIQKTDEGIRIDEVYKGSPAFSAWLEPLDVIVEIDGQSTMPMTVNEAVDLIRWPKGTPVVLDVRKHYTNDFVEVTVVRDTITIPSVRVSLLPFAPWSDNHALLIEVSIFGDDTIQVLNTALDEVLSWWKTYDALLVDVRGNGGWYLPKAIEVASFFVPKWVLITTARYSAFQDEKFISLGFDRLVSRPTVVLVDRLSASASEIVAAALREQIGATVIGTTTFGKWSIQSLHDLDDGSSLKITIGNWYPPSDISVTGTGIVPDITVPFDKEAFAWWVDNQLNAALEFLLTNGS
jgi:carboxyl-terminal processing protease